MAKEKIIEQPPVETTAAATALEKKPEISEMAAERILPTMEKPKEAAKPREKGGEGGIFAATQAQSFQKQRADAIDNILAEGLNEIFLKMKPDEQKIFKQKGEETVTKINELLNKTKLKVKKIIELIKRWLRLIPGINKFFLEQEAKIKADKIMKMKDKL